MAELATILAEIADRMAKAPERGQVATYIPELAKVDPGQFGIAVATVDGQVLAAGDADVPFSIQSVSKVFTLTLALGKVGDALWRRVGREPSGSAFNSIVQLERENGIPRNPFINAGAFVVADTVLAGHQPSGALAEIVSFLRLVADDDSILIDPAVARSETEHRFRNAALANFLRSYDNLAPSPRIRAGRLLPPLRHRHELPPARPGRPLPRQCRADLGRRRPDRLGRARPPDQRADADLRPL